MRLNALLCIDNLLESLDKMIILDELLPFLTDIQCQDAKIVMAVVGGLYLMYIKCLRCIFYECLNSMNSIKTYCTFLVFNIRYPEMHKVQGAKCAICYLVYGSSMCTEDR